MHLAKGFEFRAVAVMPCDDEVIQLQTWMEDVDDDADLEKVSETERHLLYAARTRTRDHNESSDSNIKTLNTISLKCHHIRTSLHVSLLFNTRIIAQDIYIRCLNLSHQQSRTGYFKTHRKNKTACSFGW